MHYQIYADVLFVQEWILNFYVLEMCRLSLMCTATHKRLFAASAFFGICQVLILFVPFPENMVLFYGLLFVFYIILLFVTLWLAFGKTTLRNFIKRMLYYMAYMLVIGGIFMGILPRMSFFRNSGRKVLFFLAGGIIVYFLVWHIQKKRQVLNYCGKLLLVLGEKSVEGQYFMDTGNGLCESISKKPVLLADEKWLNTHFDIKECMCRPVIYKSVGKKRGILYAFCFDKLVICKEKKAYIYEKVWIAECPGELLKNNDYQVILPIFYGTHYE